MDSKVKDQLFCVKNKKKKPVILFPIYKFVLIIRNTVKLI